MYTEIDGWRSIKNDICLKSAKKQGNGDINNYQNIELMTAMSYCAKWRTAVDVGAHVGITAFQMAKSFEHVHAYEINPKIYECMNYNLESRAVGNVTTYPVGLGQRKHNVSIKTTNKSFSTHVAPDVEVVDAVNAAGLPPEQIVSSEEIVALIAFTVTVITFEVAVQAIVFKVLVTILL